MTIINSIEHYAAFLTDRWGDYHGGLHAVGEGARIDDLFAKHYSYSYSESSAGYVEGDPRRFLGREELSFVVFRNGRLGILIEGELDITVGDETSDGLTRDRNGSLVINPGQLQAAAEYWLAKLEPMRGEYPETEFFVSHGEVAFDGRLQINAFTPLIEQDAKFYCPYEDEQRLTQLDSKISNMIYETGRNEAFRIYRQLVMSNVSIKPVDTLLEQAVGASRAVQVLKEGDYEMIAVLVRKYGAHETCSILNQALGTSLNIGDYVLASVSEKGMWCNDFGWVQDRDSATGYTKETVDAGVSVIATLDADFVLYDDVAQYFAENLKAA